MSPRCLSGFAQLAAMLAIGGCAALHPPPPASVTLPGRAPLVTHGPVPVGEWPGARWWQAYGDPTLDALIDAAVSQAPDLAAADSRIRQADAQVRITSAALGLKVDASAQLSRQRLSDNGMIPPEFLGFHWYDQSDVGVAARYQFDWWGRQQAAIEASVDRVRAVAAERQAAAQILAGSIALTYFGWQADSAREALQLDAVTLAGDYLVTAQRRVDAGLDPADRAIEAQRSLAVQRERLAMLRGSRQLRVVTLAGLLGVEAAQLPALTARPLPPVAAALPADAGTNLLARRADIAASRWRVEAALRDTDIGRAAFYPDISINALAGLSSVDAGKLLQAGSAAPRFGIAIDLPLFDAGARRARHEGSLAALDIAVADYESTIVHAAREAATALATLQQAAAQREHGAAQLAAAVTLTANARARLDRGLIPRGPLLAARLDETQLQAALLQVDLAAVQADVQLRQALGGDPAPRNPNP